MSEPETERFEEHIEGSLKIVRGGKAPKIETKVKVVLSLEHKDYATDMILAKTKELLEGCKKGISDGYVG